MLRWQRHLLDGISMECGHAERKKLFLVAKYFSYNYRVMAEAQLVRAGSIGRAVVFAGSGGRDVRKRPDNVRARAKLRT
jgi:hypothetical protein